MLSKTTFNLFKTWVNIIYPYHTDSYIRTYEDGAQTIIVDDKRVTHFFKNTRAINKFLRETINNSKEN